jgi:hypothetical protein
MIGNPPWDVIEPNSLEFFTEFDPLYRTYDKQAALCKQKELFATVPQVDELWGEYNARFKALGNWARNAADPFDITLACGKEGDALKSVWQRHRQGRVGFADSRHPFRLQGSGKQNAYKLFCEMFWGLLRVDGRLGVILPTGIYSDLGTKDLREELLLRGRLGFLYAFQNEKKIFVAADHRFKQTVVIATRGGCTQSFATRFRMGVGDSPEAREIPDDILGNRDAAMVFTPDDVRANSPMTLSLVELKCLEKEPGNRYGSALALAEDLERWLTGHAIQARPSGPARKVLKWAKRNPSLAVLLVVLPCWYFDVRLTWRWAWLEWAFYAVLMLAALWRLVVVCGRAIGRLRDTPLDLFWDGFFLPGTLLAVLVLCFYHGDPAHRKLFAWQIGLIPVCWGLVIQWLWWTRRAGPLSLALRPPLPFVVALGALCGLFIVWKVYALIHVLGQTGDMLEEVSSSILYPSMFILIFLQLAVGIEIRDQGCVTFHRFICWDEIESYDWKESPSKGSLFLRLKLGNDPDLLEVPVHPAKKDKVDRILTGCLPRVGQGVTTS